MKKYVKPALNTLKKPTLLPMIVEAIGVAVAVDRLAKTMKNSSHINGNMLNELKPII